MHPLSLFHVHRAPSGASGDEKVGLSAEECRDLQHVGDLRGSRTLLGEVHVGENRKSRRLTNTVERGKAFVQSRTPRGSGIGAVGLVEARLEDDSTRDTLRHAREMLGDAQVERVVLDDTRSGDEKKRIARKGGRERHPLA